MRARALGRHEVELDRREKKTPSFLVRRCLVPREQRAVDVVDNFVKLLAYVRASERGAIPALGKRVPGGYVVASKGRGERGESVVECKGGGKFAGRTLFAQMRRLPLKGLITYWGRGGRGTGGAC